MPPNSRTITPIPGTENPGLAAQCLLGTGLPSERRHALCPFQPSRVWGGRPAVVATRRDFLPIERGQGERLRHELSPSLCHFRDRPAIRVWHDPRPASTLGLCRGFGPRTVGLV